MPAHIAGLELIRHYMEEKDLYAADLAAMYGKKESFISNVLNGKLSTPEAVEFVETVINARKLRKKEGQ